MYNSPFSHRQTFVSSFSGFINPVTHALQPSTCVEATRGTACEKCLGAHCGFLDHFRELHESSDGLPFHRGKGGACAILGTINASEKMQIKGH